MDKKDKIIKELKDIINKVTNVTTMYLERICDESEALDMILGITDNDRVFELMHGGEKKND